jgi:hypothetical protein
MPHLVQDNKNANYASAESTQALISLEMPFQGLIAKVSHPTNKMITIRSLANIVT